MTGTVIDALTYWARAVPDQVAVDFDGDPVTYAELNTWADGVAGDLLATGVRAGDRVGIVGVNSLEWVAAALGAFKLGAIVAPFNHRMVARELADLIGDCEPTVVFAGSDLEPRVKQVHHDDPTFQIKTLEAVVAPLREGAHEPVATPVLDPEAPTAIVYTSGTTGKPKGVVFTHRTIAGEMQEWHLTEPIQPNGLRPLVMLPLFSAAGIIWGISRVVLHGGTMFLQPGLDPARAVERIVKDKITVLTGPPIMFESIASQPSFAEADLSSVTTAHVGGARVPVDLVKRWQAKGVALRQIYGQTEIGGSATAMPRDEVAEHPEQCGFGGIFTKIRVVDTDGNDLPPGEQGQILLRGPGMMPGYWRDDQATAEAIKDGWLHTGDIGVLDERGYLTYVDRLKDLIISGGLNISPMEIEQVIQSLPGVAEVAVISVADARFGETPAALIRATEPMTEADVVAWCNERLADYKVPRYVVFAQEELPRMPSGKIAKRQMASTYANIPDVHEKVR